VTTLAAGVFLASMLASAEGPRIALLVGDDVGLADEQRLRSTGTDVDRLGAVIQELGDFAPADVHVLKDRTAAEILDAVDALATGSPASIFLFYYSGHADAGALHPNGTLLPVDLLLHRLRAVRADLRIGILDACQSGASARAKGSVPAAPFHVRVEDQTSTGDILISSSAADEQSFEADHGGLFTLHWTAGLRGAADANADGQVTLGEAYEYAYAQTLRSTLAASTGPQHARFQYQLAGRRDPVLTRLAGGCLLTFHPQAEGEYVVFDGRERSVVAEMPARPGESRRLALAPGAYVVQERGPGSLRVARIQLARGDDRVLLEHQMREVPLLRLARKGSLGERHVTISGGQYSSLLGPRGLFLGSAGVEWEGVRWLSGVDLAFSAAHETHNGLTTRDAFLQASGSVLYSMRAGMAALRFGPAVGVAYLRQATAGREPVRSVGGTLGARVRADVQITQRLWFCAQVDGRALAARMNGTPPKGGFKAMGIGFLPWGAYGLGLRAEF
jgi:hypothetical protein